MSVILLIFQTISKQKKNVLLSKMVDPVATNSEYLNSFDQSHQAYYPNTGKIRFLRNILIWSQGFPGYLEYVLRFNVSM